MHLTRLALLDFRNIERSELELDRRFTVLEGPNGAGKTNVLESIYVLGNVRSFREGKNRDLLRLGCAVSTVAGTVEKAAGRFDVRLELTERKKRFLVNDKAVPSFAKYLGTLVTVIFSPADLLLLRGPASDRRRYLDRFVCSLRPAHLADLQDLETVLRSRNQLLKGGRPDRHLLEAYSLQLVPLAARVTARRLEAVGAIRPILAEVFKEIFAQGHALDAAYRCRWRPDEAPPAADLDGIAGELREALAARASDEIRSGHTLVGPHRDDWQVSLDGHPAREYASQGQTRAALLALKITEISHLHRTHGEAPVLLLDDVSSELDAQRNRQLFDFIGSIQSQTIITTTDRRHVRIAGDMRVYAVSGGSVSRTAS